MAQTAACATSGTLPPRASSEPHADDGADASAARGEVALLRALSRQPAQRAPPSLPLEIFDSHDDGPVAPAPRTALDAGAVEQGGVERQRYAADLRLAADALDGRPSEAPLAPGKYGGGANLLSMLDEMSDLAP